MEEGVVSVCERLCVGEGSDVWMSDVWVSGV